MVREKAKIWYKLRVFMWAAMFRKDFKYCYIKPWISVRFDSQIFDMSRNFGLYISFRRSIQIYIPYDIQFAYLMEQEPDAFQDIPF